MRTIQFVAPRVPFVDPRTGVITREWYLLLEQLFSWKSESVETDLVLSSLSVQGASEVQLYTAMQELRQAPNSVTQDAGGVDLNPPRTDYIAPDDIAPIIGLLRDEIAELRKAIEGLGVAP